MKKFITVLIILTAFLNVRAVDYYVNDASTVGDIYTTAVGNPGNDGLTPNTPKSSIQDVINLGLIAGDNVYIDAGLYQESPKAVGLTGTVGNPISFIGADSSLTIIEGISDPSIAEYQVILIENCQYTFWTKLGIVAQDVTAAAGADRGFLIKHNSDFNEISECLISPCFYGLDIATFATGQIPENNLFHDNEIRAHYVGVRIKALREVFGGSWAAASNFGPLNNEIYDNKIALSYNGADLSYSVIELHAIKDNSIYRNVLVMDATVQVDPVWGGAVIYLAHSVTNNYVANNYLVNLSTTATSYGIYMSDNFDYAMDFVHNSIYSVNTCFYAPNGTQNFTFKNNILYSTNGDCIDFDGNNHKLQECINNLYYFPSGNLANTGTVISTLADWQTYNPDNTNNALNAVVADPQYQNPGSWLLDIPNTSPAVDQVYNIAAGVSVDIYATARPIGPRPDIGAFENQNPLPVEFLNITSTCLGEGTQISWSTATEENNDYFTVERSLNGEDFVEIGTVDGSGNSNSILIYSFTDDFGDGAYYRVRQTDFDGQYSFSSVVASVECGAGETLKIFDNGENINIQAPAAYNGTDATVTIYTITGQLVNTFDVTLKTGKNELHVDLASASYIVKVQTSGEVFSDKVIRY